MIHCQNVSLILHRWFILSSECVEQGTASSVQVMHRATSPTVLMNVSTNEPTCPTMDDQEPAIRVPTAGFRCVTHLEGPPSWKHMDGDIFTAWRITIQFNLIEDIVYGFLLRSDFGVWKSNSNVPFPPYLYPPRSFPPVNHLRSIWSRVPFPPYFKALRSFTAYNKSAWNYLESAID